MKVREIPLLFVLWTAAIVGCAPFEFDFTRDIELVDRTVYPAADVQAFDGTGGVAAGATLPLGSFGGSSDEAITYQVDDPEVLTLSGVKDGDAHLLALKAGSTRVVATQGDKTAEVTVTVKPIYTSQVDLYPWHQFVQLPSALWKTGVAIFSSTNVTLAGVHKNTSGQVLGGFGATQWSVCGKGDTHGAIMNKELSDMVVYRSPSTPGTREEVRFGNSPPLVMEIVDPSDVATVELYVAETFLDTSQGYLIGEGDVAQVGPLSLFHLVLRTEDGTYITGSGPHTFDITDAATGESLKENYDEASSEGTMLHAGRAALVTSIPPGTSVEALVTWGDHAFSIMLEGIDAP